MSFLNILVQFYIFLMMENYYRRESLKKLNEEGRLWIKCVFITGLNEKQAKLFSS